MVRRIPFFVCGFVQSRDRIEPRLPEDLFHSKRADSLVVSGKHSYSELRRHESSLPANRRSSGFVWDVEAEIDDASLHRSAAMICAEQAIPFRQFRFVPFVAGLRCDEVARLLECVDEIEICFLVMKSGEHFTTPGAFLGIFIPAQYRCGFRGSIPSCSRTELCTCPAKTVLRQADLQPFPQHFRLLSPLPKRPAEELHAVCWLYSILPLNIVQSCHRIQFIAAAYYTSLLPLGSECKGSIIPAAGGTCCLLESS